MRGILGSRAASLKKCGRRRNEMNVEAKRQCKGFAHTWN